MELNTLDDLEKNFKDEESARKYFSSVRWGEWAVCPYCGHRRCYIVEKGKRYKCGNKGCYRKFSATAKTLIENSNIPILDWLKIIFLYTKKRGRITSIEVSSIVGIQKKASFSAVDKVEFAFKYVDRENKPFIEIFNSTIYSLCHEYERYSLVKNMQYYKNPYRVADIDDISDMKQYDKLLRYADYFINVWAKWMFLDFASPQDVLSETFIYMKEKGIKEYNADFMVKLIRDVASKMWLNYINNHPKFHELYKDKAKLYRRRQRRDLTTGFIVSYIADNPKNKLSRDEIKKNRELIEKTRNRIIQKRLKDKKFRLYEIVD